MSDADPIPGLRAMAILRWGILAVSIAIAGVTWWGFLDDGEDHETGEARFHCPMHPAITSDVAGSCPICSMRLEPIPERGATPIPEDAGPAGALPAAVGPVMLTTERRQLAGIATVAARRADQGGALRLPAAIAAREGSIAEARLRTEGFVERTVVRETGVRVRAGQTLAWVYAPEIVAAQEELLAASRWTGSGGAAPGSDVAPLAARARERLALLGLSDADIDAIVRRGRSSRTIALRAPASGWIVERTAVPGARATPEDPLYVIADLTRVWIVATALQHQIVGLEPGMHARFVAHRTSEDEGPRTHDVVLERVVPSLESATRTAEIRFVAENAELALLPGAIGEIEIDLARSERVLVPRDAVIDTGEARYVFVDRGGGLFEPRAVVVGALFGDERAITSGLAEGELVVARGGFVLDSESRLAQALSPTPLPAAPTPPDGGRR